MTAPIAPDDTAGLLAAHHDGYSKFIDECEGAWIPRQAEHAGMMAVARAVCPPGYTVVRTDDLRHAVSAMDAIGTGPDDHAAYLRLRAKVGVI